MNDIQFVGFGKIPRLFKECMITEKIDGTNAAIGITEDGRIWAQSRKRIITVEDDNFGFARWVNDNLPELMRLGPGIHFGEWYGQGIQRGYGLTDRRFALFNVGRWRDDDKRPACCTIPPILYEGEFDTENIGAIQWNLQKYGSRITPGFEAEGVMVYHLAANQYFKAPFDPNPKGNDG